MGNHPADDPGKTQISFPYLIPSETVRRELDVGRKCNFRIMAKSLRYACSTERSLPTNFLTMIQSELYGDIERPAETSGPDSRF